MQELLNASILQSTSEPLAEFNTPIPKYYTINLGIVLSDCFAAVKLHLVLTLWI